MSKSCYSIKPYKWYGIQTVPKIDKDGEIYFNVYAYKKVSNQYKDKLLIMKISENETKCKIRAGNLEYYNSCGYVVRFPGEKVRRYYSWTYDKHPMKKWKYEQLPNIPNYFSGNLDIIEELDPRLNYLVKALKARDAAISIELIKLYRAHPLDVELLIKNNYLNLVMNKQVYRLTTSTKKLIFKKLNEGAPEYYTLKDVLKAIKYNTSIEIAHAVDKYMRQGIKDIPMLCKYLAKVNTTYYMDYLTMAKKAKKNLEDPYWAFPSNLTERHDKVLQDLKKEELARLKLENDKVIKISRNLRRKYKPATIDGYIIDFPNNLEDLINQANKLNQCLITANYHIKYIDKKLMLVLIKKNDEPIATVEIKKDKSIGQFYGNEYDREKCLPPEDVKFAFNTWYNAAFNRSHQKGGFLK